jgi:hypothetical protein
LAACACTSGFFATASWRETHGSGGGERTVDSDVQRRSIENVGAYMMGRNMFSSGRGAWA